MRGIEADALRGFGDIVFVGPGTPAMAKAFARERAVGDRVLSDPDRRAFAAARLRRGIGALLHPRAWWNLWRAFRRGFRQGRVQGDPWQHGGVLVVDGDGRLLLRRRDEVAGDPLDIAAILDAVQANAVQVVD